MFNKITRVRDPNDTRRHKDVIELTRINQRFKSIPPQEPLKDLLYKPPADSPAFRPYPLKDCLDFNEADKAVRAREAQFKESKNDRKTVANFDYEINKWNKMDKEFRDDQARIDFKRQKLQSRPGVSHGFDIVSLGYEANATGAALREVDGVRNRRLNARVNSLYRRLNSPFDILTGAEHKEFVLPLPNH